MSWKRIYSENLGNEVVRKTSETLRKGILAYLESFETILGKSALETRFGENGLIWEKRRKMSFRPFGNVWQ